MNKPLLNKQNSHNFAIVIWVIVALMIVLYYTPWFKISASILYPLFLCALIIVSTVFYLLSSKYISEPKILKTRSKIFATISLILFTIMAIILIEMVIDMLKVPEQDKELIIGYVILGFAPIFAILLTGAISFLVISLKLRRKAK